MRIPVPSLAVLALLLAALDGPVHAHGLRFECRPRGDHVEIEAFYTDNTPAREALVRALDADGQVFAEGRTDADGRWRFPKPSAGRYRVEVDDGAGHFSARDLTDDLLSTGPTREEFTAFPWLKLAIGVAALLALGFGFKAARRRRSASG